MPTFLPFLQSLLACGCTVDPKLNHTTSMHLKTLVHLGEAGILKIISILGIFADKSALTYSYRAIEVSWRYCWFGEHVIVFVHLGVGKRKDLLR